METLDRVFNSCAWLIVRLARRIGVRPDRLLFRWLACSALVLTLPASLDDEWFIRLLIPLCLAYYFLLRELDLARWMVASLTVSDWLGLPPIWTQRKHQQDRVRTLLLFTLLWVALFLTDFPLAPWGKWILAAKILLPLGLWPYLVEQVWKMMYPDPGEFLEISPLLHRIGPD